MAKKEETKELQVKGENAVSTEVTNLADWGAPMPLGQDIVISKILPMQGMSKFVMDGKAAFGEFRDSLTGAKLGSITEPIPLVPFHVEKFWDILQPNEKGDFKWIRSEPLIENPAEKGYNDNLPWMDKIDGIETKRVRRMNFFVLRPQEVEDGSAIPYILAFKSTSYKEGKKLFTQMFLRNRKVGLPPPGFNIILAGRKEKNDDGSWVVPEFELGPKSSDAQIIEALNWFKLIQKGKVKIDDSDLEDLSEMKTADTNVDGAGEF